MRIRIGTRKSSLALAQTDMVIKSLHDAFPDIETEIVHITTKGDKILDKPLARIGGKGVFVSEIESLLQKGEIDIAVHSAKDLPYKLAENLEISGVLKRGNYRDVLVTPADKVPEKDSKFTVGTGSQRRRLNMQRLYPGVVFGEIRGNVDTRLRKLKSGEFDGIILAAAGLERLGLYGSEEFSFTAFNSADFLPAACQGIIAVESRKGDKISNIINQISDKNTFYAFETERRVPELLGADCTMPVGAYAEISGEKIRLTASKDCKKILSAEAEISDRFRLAEELVSKL